MAYTPQPGNGATIAIAATASPTNLLYPQDIEVTTEQTAIESTTLTNIYKTYIRGRYGFRISGTLAATADNGDFQRTGVVQGFINETIRGTPIFITVTDSGTASGGTSQAYVASAIITSLTHSMRGDELDTIRFEAQGTGTLL